MFCSKYIGSLEIQSPKRKMPGDAAHPSPGIVRGKMFQLLVLASFGLQRQTRRRSRTKFKRFEEKQLAKLQTRQMHLFYFSFLLSTVDLTVDGSSSGSGGG